MSDFVIRPYEPGDEAGIIAVILPIQQAEFGIPITAEQQPDLASIADFYLSGAGNFWVAVIIRGTTAAFWPPTVSMRRAALTKSPRPLFPIIFP